MDAGFAVTGRVLNKKIHWGIIEDKKECMKLKKKIMHIVEAFGGGVFTYIVNLSNELAAEFDIYIVYALRPQTPPEYKNYFDKKIHLIEVSSLSREINLVKDFKAFKYIRSIIKSINPDIIHLHSSKAGVLGRWAANGKNFSVFYTPHGYSFLMRDKGIKRVLYYIIEKLCARRHCTTIACGKSEYLIAVKLSRNACYVENGINVDEIQRILEKTKRKKTDCLTVYTLGRICEQKNPILFNSIAEQLSDVDFIWIGDGELRHCLTADNIYVTGWMERPAALEEAANADIFLLTSLWEGLPMALLEAMYLDKICIVSNIPGNQDVIQDTVNGYLCHNLEEFVERILYICDNNNNDMLRRARQDVIERYSSKKMLKKYMDIYQKSLFE